MFGSHDHDEDKHDDNTPVAGVVTDNGVLGDNTSMPSFDTSNVSLPSSAPEAPATADEPADEQDEPEVTPLPSSPPAHDDEHLLKPGGDADLIQIKQQALQELSPLVDHLEQSPEEKFRTTMMMIQASDDQSLLHTAFESAKGITDDKVRAQALLDVINEINYFTQQAK